MQIDSFISDFEIIRQLLHLILKYGTLTPKAVSEMVTVQSPEKSTK